MEHYGVHATAEVFVEHSHYGFTLGCPLCAVVVILAHIDVLCLIGCNQYLVLLCQLLLILATSGHVGQLFSGAVVLVNQGNYLFQVSGAIVGHLVLIVYERADKLHHVGGVSVVQFQGRHLVAVGVVRAIDAVAIQCAEVGVLVQLVHLARLLLQRYKLLPCVGVGLRVSQELLHQFQCLNLVFVKARECDGGFVTACRHAVCASQLIELLLQLISCHLVGAQIVEITCSGVQTLVGLDAEVECKLQCEQTVGVVLNILYGQPLLGFSEGDVALEVDKHRLNGFGLCVCYLCHVGTLLVAV